MAISRRKALLGGILLAALMPIAVSAGDLEVGKIYRLGMTVPGLEAVGEKESSYTAKKNSKFQVLSILDGEGYVIQFNKIYTSRDDGQGKTKWVGYDKSYKLPEKVGDVVRISEIARESLTGLSAGPLIVPFKFRLDDESLAGDAELGVYAGITFEPGCTKSNWCFRVTPLISAGLSQVSVADENDTENKTAMTIAVGFLITNWADLNIGLIYGQDRIGDSSWEHEGDGWISFMVGWQL